MTDKPDPYDRLRALGLTLPPPPPPVANFVGLVQVDKLVFLSGQGPVSPLHGYKLGKVGQDYTTEEGYEHARIVGLNLLSVLHHELGSLSRVVRVVKLLGMVNATPVFTAHPAVINGCSDLFVEVFGPKIGAHARSAVGVESLPGNISVEIEAVMVVEGGI